MVVYATYLKYHRCRLSCLPFVWHFFSLWHTCAQKHTPGPGGDLPRRVTRAWDSCLFVGRTLLDMVTMCDLHVSIVVLIIGLALSLHCDMLASDLIICLARPHGSWIFFFAKPKWTWWRSAPRDVSDMKKLCMEVSVVVLQMPFTWDFILAGGHVRASAGALAVHTALILAGGHVREAPWT